MIAGIPNLEAFLRAIGKGYVYVGDLEVASGLEPLGATEGDITVEKNDSYNHLTFPEYTGDLPHDAKMSGINPVVNIPLILGNPELYEKVSPVGQGGGGFTDQQPVVKTSLVIFAEEDIRGGISFGGGPPKVWDPIDAAPNSFFAWLGYFTEPGLTYRQPDGGKVIQEVRFQLMHGPAHIVNGYKAYAMGGANAAAANANLLI